MHLTTNTPISKSRALIPSNLMPTTASAKTSAAPTTTPGHPANHSQTTQATTTQAAPENGTASAPTPAQPPARTRATPADSITLSSEQIKSLQHTINTLRDTSLKALQQGVLSRHSHQLITQDINHSLGVLRG